MNEAYDFIHDELKKQKYTELSVNVNWVVRMIAKRDSQHQSSVDEEMKFLNMILNAYKVVNKPEDYRNIFHSIVQQAETRKNKLLEGTDPQLGEIVEEKQYSEGYKLGFDKGRAFEKALK